MDWLDDAVCRTVDPEAWFPEVSNEYNPAVSICASCPVQRQCLKMSFDIRAEYGIWGGLPAHKRVKKQRSYINRSKPDRERMIDSLLNEIDEVVEQRAESMAASRERELAKKRKAA
jgi:WhiB family redox-sensing transcriptional regulator